MYIQKNKKTEKISWISIFFPQNGPSSPKNSPIDQSSYPPGLLTGPP